MTTKQSAISVQQSALDEWMRNWKGDCNFMGEHERDLYTRCETELALYREAYRLLLLCRNEYPGTLYVTYEKDGRNVRDMTDELKQKMEGLTK